MLSNPADAAQTSTVRDEWYEAARDDGEIGRAVGGLQENLENLLVGRANRDHESCSELELLEERRRGIRGGGGHGDASEGRLLGQPLGAVRDVHAHATAVTGLVEARLSTPGKLRNPLQRVHLARQLGEA